MTTFATILNHAAIAVIPVAGAFASWAIYHGGQYLKTQIGHVQNTSARNGLQWALSQAEGLATHVVTDLNQTTVNTLKKAGTWNATAGAKVSQQARDTLQTLLSHEATTILSAAHDHLPTLLSTLIESAVATAKNKMASSATVPPSSASTPTSPVATQG